MALVSYKVLYPQSPNQSNHKHIFDPVDKGLPSDAPEYAWSLEILQIHLARLQAAELQSQLYQNWKKKKRFSSMEGHFRCSLDWLRWEFELPTGSFSDDRQWLTDGSSNQMHSRFFKRHLPFSK